MKRMISITEKFLLVWIGLILYMSPILATHNRAGEITLRQVIDLTYEITITTYTYTLSPATAARNELEVQWGDNSSSLAPRKSMVNLPNDYTRNKYISLHTFPGPGTYTIVVQDPNRNYGVKNIPNSVNVIFSIKTTITINPQIGNNNTPVLLNPPFDKAALNQLFIHNPSAFDPDGDSISYKLTVCTQQNGQPIPNYTLPPASDTLYVDPKTGDLVWDTPIDTGIYNIAMNIEEWRNKIKIGNIVRDMQVEVYRTTNNPPVNGPLPPLCVEAGTLISIDINSTDIDGDSLVHFFTGGPLILGPDSAIYSTISSVPGSITSRLNWQTTCEHVRKQPYTIVVKTEDRNHKLVLIDIDNLNINVLGPAPKNVLTTPGSNQIRVQWDRYTCGNIKSYLIYRKIGNSMYDIDSCTYGLPASSGFTLIGTNKSLQDTFFIDDNQGLGLSQGIDYCYRIVAVFKDGAESFPSDEVCTNLVPGSPSLLNSSVIVNDKVTGEIFISWAKPLHLDTIPANGPYEYIIYRSNDLWGLNMQEIHRFTTSDLNDTTYTDSNLNTTIYPYSYSVELYNNEGGMHTLIGKPENASTFYPEIKAGDNHLDFEFIKNVPWLNDEYTINRYNQGSGIYDSIGNSNSDFYTDDNLVNGNEYCYLIRSKGKRVLDGKEYFTSNLSHIVCATPIDTVPPCPPILTVNSLCDSGYNDLRWSIIPGECSEDIIKYKIYYSPQNISQLSLLDSTLSRSDTFYIHRPENTLAACYYLTAVDSFNNESMPSVQICVDKCFDYKIPNVFTPDGDGIGDILHPFPYQFIDKIDLKIFNRWGQLVYETSDPDINWNGKFKNTNQMVSSGVYYYICDVYELRLTGLEIRNVVGFIHVFSDNKSSNNATQ